jgi:hypothetical protein
MLPDLGPEYRLPQLGRGDENAKKWEKEWQQCLHDWWDVPGGRPPLITSIHTQMKLCLDDVSHNNVARDALELVKLNTCALQEKLSDTAICMLVHYFESRWEEAPTAVRETLILGSLVRITRASQDDRHWCPEATVELLVQDGDNGLLAMLCHFTQPVYGAPSITKPILLPHPTIDAHLELVDSSRNSDAFLFEVEKIRVRRAAFFTELLLEVLHATVCLCLHENEMLCSWLGTSETAIVRPEGVVYSHRTQSGAGHEQRGAPELLRSDEADEIAAGPA